MYFRDHLPWVCGTGSPRQWAPIRNPGSHTWERVPTLTLPRRLNSAGNAPSVKQARKDVSTVVLIPKLLCLFLSASWQLLNFPDFPTLLSFYHTCRMKAEKPSPSVSIPAVSSPPRPLRAWPSFSHFTHTHPLCDKAHSPALCPPRTSHTLHCHSHIRLQRPASLFLNLPGVLLKHRLSAPHPCTSLGPHPSEGLGQSLWSESTDRLWLEIRTRVDLPDYNVISFKDPYRCFPLNATAHATVSGEKPVEFAMSYYFLVDFPPLAPGTWGPKAATVQSSKLGQLFLLIHFALTLEEHRKGQSSARQAQILSD